MKALAVLLLAAAVAAAAEGTRGVDVQLDAGLLRALHSPFAARVAARGLVGVASKGEPKPYGYGQHEEPEYEKPKYERREDPEHDGRYDSPYYGRDEKRGEHVIVQLVEKHREVKENADGTTSIKSDLACAPRRKHDERNARQELIVPAFPLGDDAEDVPVIGHCQWTLHHNKEIELDKGLDLVGSALSNCVFNREARRCGEPLQAMLMLSTQGLVYEQEGREHASIRETAKGHSKVVFATINAITKPSSALKWTSGVLQYVLDFAPDARHALGRGHGGDEDEERPNIKGSYTLVFTSAGAPREGHRHEHEREEEDDDRKD